MCRRPALGLLDDVVADARRIAAALARDDVHASALAPDLELLDSRGTEGVGAAQKDAPALPRRATGELSAGSGLAGAVDAHKEHAGRHVVKGVALGRGELGGQAVGQGALELVRTGETLLRGELPQVV